MILFCFFSPFLPWKLSHPLLYETVWLQQNVLEEAEAHYHKMQVQGMNTPTTQDADGAKKLDKVEHEISYFQI